MVPRCGSRGSFLPTARMQRALNASGGRRVPLASPLHLTPCIDYFSIIARNLPGGEPPPTISGEGIPQEAIPYVWGGYSAWDPSMECNKAVFFPPKGVINPDCTHLYGGTICPIKAMPPAWTNDSGSRSSCPVAMLGGPLRITGQSTHWARSARTVSQPRASETRRARQPGGTLSPKNPHPASSS
jgi:hypothetical protein